MLTIEEVELRVIQHQGQLSSQWCLSIWIVLVYWPFGIEGVGIQGIILSHGHDSAWLRKVSKRRIQLLLLAHKQVSFDSQVCLEGEDGWELANSDFA